jgi:hypothetical protein
MCASCGFPAAPGHWTEAGAANGPDRLRARFRRAQILQAVLPSYGLTAYDDGLIPGMTVATLTGDQALTADLDEVWRAAERMSGQPIDPLDSRFLSDAEDEGRRD